MEPYFMNGKLVLNIPDTNEYISPEDTIQIGRFESTHWIVKYGWFEFDGNRPFCGWYLWNPEDQKIKPLLKTDLYDCYMVINN